MFRCAGAPAKSKDIREIVSANQFGEDGIRDVPDILVDADSCLDGVLARRPLPEYLFKECICGCRQLISLYRSIPLQLAVLVATVSVSL